MIFFCVIYIKGYYVMNSYYCNSFAIKKERSSIFHEKKYFLVKLFRVNNLKFINHSVVPLHNGKCTFNLNPCD